MIQKDLSSNSITPLYISRRRSLTDTISLLSKPSTRVFQGEHDKVWNSHMFFAGISELWDLGWSCVDQEHGFKVTEPIQHGAVTKMSVLMSAFVSRSFLWPGDSWEAGIVTILKHPFGFGKQICLIWNQFGDEMDLGRRRKTFPNLSWNGSDARESGAWWSILFFCDFNLETILDILDRGRGAREEDPVTTCWQGPLTDGLSSKLWQNVSDDSLMEH